MKRLQVGDRVIPGDMLCFSGDVGNIWVSCSETDGSLLDSVLNLENRMIALVIQPFANLGVTGAFVIVGGSYGLAPFLTKWSKIS